MCNERYVGQGMEGFISGSFIFRYNLQNPNNKIFAQIEDKIWQEVDNVFYPTTWLRVKIRGVQLNNNGEIVAISLLTKYGTGDTPTFGARENFYEDSPSAWNDTPTLLSEDSSTVGYEGHTAIVELSNLWDHSDKKIFHFFANPEKNASGESAFISSLSINVRNIDT